MPRVVDAIHDPHVRDRRKASFDAVAADYDRYRAGYPEEVVACIVASAHLREGSRALEIGCGTGQLSVPLAERGVDLVALDRGPHLAAVATRNLARFPRAHVEVAAFEDWPLPREPFNAVVCANAFHWLDPEVRFSKSAQALEPGGFLTIVHPHHVAGGTAGFFEDTQPCYTRWGLSDDPHFQLPTATTAPFVYPELGSRGEYGAVRRERLEIARAYTAESYVGLLKTDSMVAMLDPESRQGFLHDIGQLIESEYQGNVCRNFLYEVVTAQRVA
jgi:SAM-dependent methyltransferase